MIIDIHTHIIPEKLPDWKKKFGYGEFVSLRHHHPCKARMMVGGKFFREIENNCWNPEKRIKECRHHRVDVQVLSTIPVLFSYWARPKDCLELSRFLNDHMAETVYRYPKKFIGLGTLPLQSPKLAVKELERCKKIGLAGIEIGSHVNEWNLDNSNLLPVFQLCEELGMSVFVHPWEMMGQDKMKKYWLPWLVGMPAETSRAICSMIFGGLFAQLPKLRVAFAHGGGSFPATIGRIEQGFLSRPDIVAVDSKVNPKEYLGKFWLDSLTHDEKMLDYVVGLVGANRVALGSDYPFPLGENEPGHLIRSMNFTSDMKEMLLSGAALEWLKMTKEQFGF